jgi:pyrroloquinoline quinone biosynthesis protein E
MTQDIFQHRGPDWSALPLPIPAMGVAAFAAERQRALQYCERRAANYALYQAHQRRSAAVDFLPIKLDIENVSRCNFRCTMCVVSDWPKRQRAADMPFVDFTRLLDEQYGLLEIKLQGIGEPSLQRDTFFDMIRLARSRCIWVRTTTNASLLHLNDNFRKYIDADTNEIQISIDGADAPTYESIRRGGVFERVCENCRRINAYSAEQDTVRTKMWTVVQQQNKDQLEALVDLAADLGFRHQVFSVDLTGWGIDEWQARNEAAGVEVELTTDRLQALVRRGEGLGVRVGFWAVGEKYDTRSVDTLCPWPFERAVVSSDLRNVPCCTIGNPDVAELAAGTWFSDAWQGDDYAAFRQAHLDGDIPAFCQACYVNRAAADDG